LTATEKEYVSHFTFVPPHTTSLFPIISLANFAKIEIIALAREFFLTPS
jgi:hypothetical protein